MKVSFGEYRGRTIEKSNNKLMRPTTGIGKSVIFNSVEFDNKRVLDLFAGSGGLGIESLSAGASWVSFSDIDYGSIKAIKQTLKKFKTEEERYSVYKTDFRMAIKRAKDIDIVFIDPPFTVFKYYYMVFEGLLKKGVLNENAILIIEKITKLELQYPVDFEIIKTKKLGDNELVILKRK